MQHKFSCGPNGEETRADGRSQGSEHPERKDDSPTTIPLPLSAVEEVRDERSTTLAAPPPMNGWSQSPVETTNQ